MSDTPTLNQRMNALLEELIAGGLTLHQIADHVDEECVRIAMKRSKNRVTPAARTLGIHRNTLHNKLAAMDWPLLVRVDGASGRRQRG